MHQERQGAVRAGPDEQHHRVAHHTAARVYRLRVRSRALSSVVSGYRLDNYLPINNNITIQQKIVVKPYFDYHVCIIYYWVFKSSKNPLLAMAGLNPVL